MNLLILSIAPVVVLAFYIIYRDKYEREPFGMLLRALLAGMLTIPPIIVVERIIANLAPAGGMLNGFYEAFAVAGFTEELFKFIALYIVIWSNKNFNEKFDGIVYAVFVSLGFATIENIQYVFANGENVAYLRAFTAVPAHALFGVAMGYYFGLAKFFPGKRNIFLIRSFLEAFVLHGAYDFILMSGKSGLLWLFIPYILYLWYIGLKRMKHLSDISIYRK